MVKPILVPTAIAPSIAAASESGVTGDPPPEAAAKAASVNVAPGGDQAQSINFSDVFAELQKYKQENNESLSIPVSHPAITQIIDSLSESSQGVEGLFKKRWEEQFMALKDFKENFGDLDVPQTYPTLGKWVRIQREQYSLYEQRMPNALTKKRYDKLKELGFGNGDKPDDSESDDENASSGKQTDDHLGNKPAVNVKQKDEETSDECDFNMNVGVKNEGSEHWSNQATPEKVYGKKLSEGTTRAEHSKKGGKISKLKHKSMDRREAPANDADVLRKDDKEPKKGSHEEVIVPLNGAEKKDDSAKVSKRLKGKCDVCEKKDGFWGHNLQQCKQCKVLVHELCYGMPETDCKDLDFVCHACKAVGQKVEVNVPSKIGGPGKKMGEKREMIKQEGRPTDCILCTHNKGIHAMHPLLDIHGPGGRQLCVKSPGHGGKATKKLAWVHTLCASAICANPRTQGSVYGCDKDGRCYGESSEDEKTDEENGKVKGNKSKTNSTTDDEDGEPKTVATCYYAIATEDGWSRCIKEHRSLKCFICGLIDRSWKIPVQCPAGDKEEYSRWKGRHPKGTVCYVAMHVGCARWGCIEPEGSHLEMMDSKRCKLCYFTPGRYVGDEEMSKGSDDDANENETIAHCYCKAHAREIVENNPNRKKNLTKAAGSSLPGKAKHARKLPEKKSAKVAQTSFKKSMNSIRPKDDNKKVPLKRKSSTGQAPVEEPVTGPVPLKRKSSTGKAAEAESESGPVPLKRKSSTGKAPGAESGAGPVPLKRKSSAGKAPGAESESGPVSLKRKSSAGKAPGAVFGAIPKKSRHSVGFSEENSMQFPFKGRSASALAGSAFNTHHPSVPDASNGVAASMLKRSVTGVMNEAPGKLPEKRRPSATDVAPSILKNNEPAIKHRSAPDLPTSGPAAMLKSRDSGFADGQSEYVYGKSRTATESSEPNVSSEPLSGKRKSQAFPDLPTSGSFKRMKMGD